MFGVKIKKIILFLIAGIFVLNLFNVASAQEEDGKEYMLLSSNVIFPSGVCENELIDINVSVSINLLNPDCRFSYINICISIWEADNFPNPDDKVTEHCQLYPSEIGCQFQHTFEDVDLSPFIKEDPGTHGEFYIYVRDYNNSERDCFLDFGSSPEKVYAHLNGNPDECKCLTGRCCDFSSRPYQIKSYGSQPNDLEDYYFCSGSNSPTGTNYVKLRNYYCLGISSTSYTYDDSTEDTCGTCEYCQSGQSTCKYYSPSTSCGTCKNCNGAGSCSNTPSDDSDCGTVDCSNWYVQTGTESPTTTEYCYNKADITSNRCEGFGDCKDSNTADCNSQSNEQLKYSCGTCKYISSSSCSGTTLGSCSNYPQGTSCGTNKECDGNGNCADINQCEGTDISCGIYPNCLNCNSNDGCDGDYYKNYYCASNPAGCSFTSDNCNDCSCSCGGYNTPETIANGNCNDGKDNDCDGKIDSADSGCYENNPPTTPISLLCNREPCTNNKAFAGNIEINCSGSIDTENDSITYFIDAYYKWWNIFSEDAEHGIGNWVVESLDGGSSFNTSNAKSVQNSYSIEMYDAEPGTSESIRARHYFNTTNQDNYIVHFWVYPAQTGTLWSFGFSDRDINISTWITFSHTGNIEYGSGVSCNPTAIEAYNPQEWYKFDIHVNVSTRTMDVHVNDILKANAVEVCPTWEPNDFVQLQMRDNTGTYYIDEIYVRKYSEEPVYSWKAIGSHSQTDVLDWNISNIPEQSGVDLRCRAIDLQGSNSYSGYYNPAINLTIKNLTTVNLILKKGWNLISFPLKLINNSINDIFKNISSIFSYNKSWLYYINRTKNNFDKINESYGYWIKSLQNQILTVKGTEFDNFAFDLNQGWNLVGYPSLNKTNISKIFQGVNITKAYAYNGTWLSYIPNRRFNSLKTMKPGHGYWVKLPPQEKRWWNSNWTRRKSITITDNSGLALHDYSLKVNITYNNDMQPDFDDLRFINENQNSKLNYWIEEKIDSDYAVVWVKVPEIPSNSNAVIYMYYGSELASTNSNPNAAFIFYEDIFIGWQTQQGTVNQGTALSAGSNTASAYKNFTKTKINGFELKFDSYLDSSGINYVGIANSTKRTGGGDNRYWWQVQFKLDTENSLDYDDAPPQSVGIINETIGNVRGTASSGMIASNRTPLEENAWTNAVFRRNQNGYYRFYRNGTEYSTISEPAGNPNTWMLGAYFNKIEWHGRFNGDTIDNLRLRHYIEPEPAYSIGE